MFKKLLAGIQRWFAPVYRIAWVSEKPERMDRRTVYLIGEDNAYWAAVFICPCGCKADVWLNLLGHEDRPTWTVEGMNGRKADITPSVWRQTGCRSHFLIKQGRLIWAGAGR
jgi:hypothetical protein